MALTNAACVPGRPQSRYFLLYITLVPAVAVGPLVMLSDHLIESAGTEQQEEDQAAFCYLSLNFIGLGQEQVSQAKHLVLSGAQPDLCGRLLPTPFHGDCSLHDRPLNPLGHTVEG